MDFPAFLKAASDEDLREALPKLQLHLNQSLNNRDAGGALCYALPLVDVLREIQNRRSRSNE